MKKIMIVALLAGTVFCADAQTKKTPGARVQKAMMAKLNLTPDQQTKAEAIFAAKAAKIDSLTATGANAEDKATKKQKRAINTDAEIKLLAILTDDQKKAYEDFKVAQKEKAKNKVAAAEAVAAPKTTPPGE